MLIWTPAGSLRKPCVALDENLLDPSGSSALGPGGRAGAAFAEFVAYSIANISNSFTNFSIARTGPGD